MQQHLMQQNPLMAFAHPGSVTTDLIQQYLDENKQLILAILDNQSSGKVDECAANQAKLQRNLMYLAAIADSQPQMPTIPQVISHTQGNECETKQHQYMQYQDKSGPRYLQPQQTQQMTPESVIAARSSMLYAQASLSTLQQQQQALHGQPGMSSGGHTGLQMLYGEAGIGSRGPLSAGSFPDFALNRSTSKQEMGSAGSSEGKGGNSGGQSGDGSEPLYMKGSEGGDS